MNILFRALVKRNGEFRRGACVFSLVKKRTGQSLILSPSTTTTTTTEQYGILQNEVQLFELNFIKQHPDGLISLLVLERIFASMMLPVSEVSDLFESLSEPIKKSSTGVMLAEQLKAQLNTSIGAKAPDFEGPSPDGSSIKLYENLGKVTLIDFWAAWCGPCRMVGPVIAELAEDYGDKAVVGKLNVDQNPETSMKFGIRSIPTVLFMKNGEVVDKLVGASSKQAYAAKLEALMN